MANKITTQQNLLTEINEHLQCPICLELPKNKINICESCSCSFCEDCFKKMVPRQFVRTDETTYFLKSCPQNCPVSLYRPQQIQNLLWNQLAEVFRNNAHLVSPEKHFWNMQSAIKYVRENNILWDLAPLCFPFFLIAMTLSAFFQAYTDSSTLPCLKTWNKSSVQDKTKEHFRIEKDHWKGNKTDSEQIAFLNLIFKETRKWPKRDLEWLRNGTLFLAAQYGSLESFFYILEKPNIHPNIIDEDGIAPLHLTFIDEDEQRGERKAKILQLFGADVVNSEASTALHAAAKWGTPNTEP